MRLFVAIRPPAPVRDALLDAMDERPGVRWQDEDQLHLTLAFLGEVDPRVEQDLVDSLAAIRLPPFEVTIRGVGHFEHKGVPSTLWAGLAPSEPLARLQARVVAACRRAGTEPDRQSFRPHVTLARLGRSSPPAGSSVPAGRGSRAGESFAGPARCPRGGRRRRRALVAGRAARSAPAPPTACSARPCARSGRRRG